MSRQSADGVWGGEGSESPVLKSLFDIKGNSKYKMGDDEKEKKTTFMFGSKDMKRLSEMTADKGVVIKQGGEEVKTSNGPFAKAVNPFEKKDFNIQFKSDSNANPFAGGAGLFTNPFGKDKKEGE